MGFLSTTNHTPTAKYTATLPRTQAIYTSIPMLGGINLYAILFYAAFVAADIFEVYLSICQLSRDDDLPRTNVEGFWCAGPQDVLCSFTISFLGPPTPSIRPVLDKRKPRYLRLECHSGNCLSLCSSWMFFPDEQFTHFRHVMPSTSGDVELFTVRVGTSPTSFVLSDTNTASWRMRQTRLL